MIYRVIGVMSGSSLDGLDIACVEFQENGGKWTYDIIQADCYSYTSEWAVKLRSAASLSAEEYQLLHAEYGHYIGRRVNEFIEKNHLHYQVALVSSHGHTTFHMPMRKMTAQLGDGAAIAAETALPVVSDLRALDVAFGGQGAPIVPVGERLLLGSYDLFLNIGGIANISFNAQPYIAFDVCPANRVLNMLANEAGREYDNQGNMAASGKINQALLQKLNELEYYLLPFPKSLANSFGTDVVYPLIQGSGCSTQDALRTYVEHIIVQIINSLTTYYLRAPNRVSTERSTRLLATGGGAFNRFLIDRLRDQLGKLNIEVVVPGQDLVQYKEAMIMGFIGVLRWRQEYNVYSSVTGAERDSINGALWIGQEA